jgi:protoporphyrinogen oxidase
MSERNIIVLGGGLAGLGFVRNAPESRIFEADSEPGGHARSHELAGAWFDQGAHICHSQNQEWLNLVCAHTPMHEMTKSVVLNHKADRWFSYPVQNHLADLSKADCEAALKDFLAAQETYAGQTPANYEEWCRFQYGDFLVENFYRLYTEKYWHVPMSELATDWLGGRLLPSQVDNILAGAKGHQEENQAVFSKFRYPKQGGFFGMLKPLYDEVNLQVNKRAVEVDAASKRVHFSDGTAEDFDTLVSTIPLPQLVAMIPDAPESVREAAGKLRALRHYCVNLIVEQTPLSPANWFYVYDPEIATSRVSFPFSLSGEASSQTAIQAEIFVPGDARPDEEAMRDQTLANLSCLLKFSESDITASEIRCMPFSYVISDLHRADAVSHVREWLSRQGIETAGLFGNWAYIWSDRAYASGQALAKSLGASR